ncbi:hypothetical protein HELRODRAFT_74511 [Helobdella robusta]|uniref:Uncharacterized protein n=1 Tax=Helobdella robusta TaxID=6412 RepID=T1G1S1_HELRO|nr:hypothetical protein HELRODRAFT_74511 [Helobdella robusta]ESO08784.1 hypothetical protein HELRODRAFT_74511 [Helobdella robusta]
MPAGNKQPSNPILSYLSLATLTVQNATQTLVMRYVRTRPGDMFFSSSAVCMSETVKCIFCLGIIFVQEKLSFKKWWDHLAVNMFREPLDCLMISVPGFLYVIQNNLLYIAASNLEAAKFQVAYQLKLLTTALFSVIMLQKKLSKLQWLSLIILTVGVALVQLPTSSTSSSSSSSSAALSSSPLTPVKTVQSEVKGFVAVVAACILSGFSGVYFEKLLKNTPQSVYVRNVQLGFLGMVLGLIVCYLKDGSKVQKLGFFYGYDAMVWLTVMLLALGGLVVAVVVRYADNILKGFATSGSIIIACLVSMVLFDFQPNSLFYLGTIFVMLSVYMYSKYVYSDVGKPLSMTANK